MLEFASFGQRFLGGGLRSLPPIATSGPLIQTLSISSKSLQALGHLSALRRPEALGGRLVLRQHLILGMRLT